MRKRRPVLREIVYNKGLTDKKRIRAKTMKGVIELELKEDGMVRVSMGMPSFELFSAFQSSRAPFARDSRL